MNNSVMRIVFKEILEELLRTLEDESFLVPTRCKPRNPPLWFDEQEVALVSRIRELVEEKQAEIDNGDYDTEEKGEL